MKIDDILHLKALKQQSESKTVQAEIGNTGVFLTCRCPSSAEQLDTIIALRSAENDEKRYAAYRSIVYACAEELHSADAIDALGVRANPEMAVDAIMTPLDCMSIGDFIFETFFKSAEETVKN